MGVSGVVLEPLRRQSEFLLKFVIENRPFSTCSILFRFDPDAFESYGGDERDQRPNPRYEFKENSKNNIAVSILTATIIISISLLVKESLYLLLESFVPYPDVPRFF